MGRVFVNEEACIGCRLCEVFCKLEHSATKNLGKAFKRESPAPLARLRVEEEAEVSFSTRCQQCEESPCARACITGALTYNREKGVVEFDEERCVGCWTCVLVCPYAAVNRDTLKGKTLRCDLCGGEEIPACVRNCPNEALSYLETKTGVQSVVRN